MISSRDRDFNVGSAASSASLPHLGGPQPLIKMSLRAPKALSCGCGYSLCGAPVQFPECFLKLADTMAETRTSEQGRSGEGFGTCRSVAGNSVSAAPDSPPSQPDMLSPHPLHLSLGFCPWRLHRAVAELCFPAQAYHTLCPLV